MGGYGSTRWGWGSTRQATGECLFLDMPYLRKLGMLEPGAVVTRPLAWSRGGRHSGSIIATGDYDAGRITLTYSTQRPGEEWQHVREEIGLDFTPNNYGGPDRPWFRCPHCYKRRGVLYSVGGRFRCRQCHNLAYTSTRADALERSFARADTLRKRLGAKTGGGLYGERFPPKPKGMHRTTYSRLIGELWRETDLANALFHAELQAMAARVDTLTGSMRALDKLIR